MPLRSKGIPFDYTMLGTCIMFSSSKTCFRLIVSCKFVHCSAFGLAESGERGRKSNVLVRIVFFPARPKKPKYLLVGIVIQKIIAIKSPEKLSAQHNSTLGLKILHHQLAILIHDNALVSCNLFKICLNFSKSCSSLPDYWVALAVIHSTIK